MRRLVPILLTLLLAGCNPVAGVAVEESRVGLPVIPGRPGVAYFTLRAAATPMQLIGVTSPQIQRIELHDSGNAGGVMRMGPLEDRHFPESGRLVFEPGGKHAMLFGIDPAVRPGGTVSMTFDFDNAPDVTVAVPVEATGGS